MIDKHRNVLLVSLKLVIPNFAPFEVERLQLSEIPLRCFRLTVKTLGFATELLPVFSSLNILWQSYKFFARQSTLKCFLFWKQDSFTKTMTFTQIFIGLVPEKYHFSRHFPRLCRRNERWNKLILYIAIKTRHRDSLHRCNYTCDYFQPISKKRFFHRNIAFKKFFSILCGGKLGCPRVKLRLLLRVRGLLSNTKTQENVSYCV